MEPDQAETGLPVLRHRIAVPDRSRHRQGRGGRSGRDASRSARGRARLADRAAQRAVPELPRGDGLRGRSRRPELRVLRLAGARELRRDQGADPARTACCRSSIDTARVRDDIRRWWRSKWLAPGRLARAALVDTVHGLYIPYWTFDAQVHCPWDAEAGHYYYVTVEGRDSKGRRVTRQERRIRWEAGVRRRRSLLRRRAGAGHAGAAARLAAAGRAVSDAGGRALRHGVSLRPRRRALQGRADRCGEAVAGADASRR